MHVAIMTLSSFPVEVMELSCEVVGVSCLLVKESALVMPMTCNVRFCWDVSTCVE